MERVEPVTDWRGRVTGSTLVPDPLVLLARCGCTQGSGLAQLVRADELRYLRCFRCDRKLWAVDPDAEPVPVSQYNWADTVRAVEGGARPE